MKRITITSLLLALAACGANPTSSYDGPADKYRGKDHVISGAGDASCQTLSSQSGAVALQRTNQFRASNGLSPMRENPKLSLIASEQACHMARTGILSHAGPQNEGPKHRAAAKGYQARMIAENIGAGPFDLNRILSEWEKSSGHRANILLGPVKDYGIGTATGPDGSRYWVAVYGVSK